MSDKVKLSKKQKEIVRDLQNGSILITSSLMRGAIVTPKRGDYHITSRVLYNLVDKGLISQEWDNSFHFALTPLGKTIEL